VPISPALLDVLDMVHGIREQQGRRGRGHHIRLWPSSPMTGWRAVHAVMRAADLAGVPASPKGLRHGFGMTAVTAGIPLNLVQKWLGHAQLSTPPSMPMPSAPRKRIPRGGCGDNRICAPGRSRCRLPAPLMGLLSEDECSYLITAGCTIDLDRSIIQTEIIFRSI
jgi:hypothetical protein